MARRRELEQTAFLYGGNGAFIEDLYARYLSDPASIDASWLEITNNRINGGATITGTTQALVFEGNDVKGGVRIYDNPAID